MENTRVGSEPVRRYEGNGVAEYSDGQRLSGDYLARQEHDGSITLECWTTSVVGPPAWIPEFFDTRSARLVALRGTTTDGRPLHATGHFLSFPREWSTSKGARCDYELTGRTELIVGTDDTSIQPGSWRFGLTNVLLPTVASDLKADGSQVCDLQLNDVQVRIEGIKPYGFIAEKLHSGSRIFVTATASVPGHLLREVACELVDDLCSLLSIAEGSVVSWVYMDRIESDGTVSQSLHRPGITRPFNGALPLIRPRREDRRMFLESTFAEFSRSKKQRRLRVIALAYADVRTTGFLEVRTLQMLSHIEMIIGADAELRKDSMIADEDAFEAARPMLVKLVAPLLELAFPRLGRDKVKEMTEHFRSLNYTSFKNRLRRTMEGLGITALPKPEIRALAETRNALVHRGSFATSEPSLEWVHVASILDRLLMGLLKYNGPHVNVRDLPHESETDRSL